MSFASCEFLAFLAGLILLYYLLPKKWQWVLLLAGSIGFYLCGGVKAVFYLLFTIFTTYLAGRILGRMHAQYQSLAKEDRKARKKTFEKRRKAVVWVVCILNFSVLFAVKYLAFVLESVSRYTASPVQIPELLLPLGISFFIFQSIGYVVDCYRGKVQPERNFFKYALFVSFFPQIVQGPIGRFDALAPQLTAEHPLDWENLRSGILLLLWGYFKKLLIAERVAPLVNTVFSDTAGSSGVVLALGVLGYSVQLYCDFSGGIDISRGVAQMLGIELAENFRRPIFAKTLTEYWRRWHISLGAWMRDYVFYPLALSKPFRAIGAFARKHFQGMLSKIFATSLATFVIYFIIGIWHGANFRYLAFGFYNGFLITGGLLLEPFFIKVRQKLPIRWDGKAWHAVQMLRTAAIVFVGRYITRAARLTEAIRMLWRTATDLRPKSLLGGTLFSLGMDKTGWLIVVLGVFGLLAVETYEEKGGSARKLLFRQKPLVQGVLMLMLVAAVLLLGAFSSYTGAGFIYAQY